MNNFKTKRGFTLIELLVVIAIIGILSSIVLASLNTARLKARDARRIADLKQLQLAQQLYYDANTAYAPTLSALTPTYIANIPTDPVGNIAYPYDVSTSPASYHIGANLEQSTNAALASDSDTDTTIVKGSDDAEDCAGAVTGRYCYDVTP